MKNTSKKISKYLLTLIISMFVTFYVVSAWATTVSLIQPEDTKQAYVAASVDEIPAEISEKAKTNAPEPSTLALFGGGFLGMVVNFIRRTYAAAKRAFDITAAVLGFIVLSPLLIGAAILVKLTSKGPIIYSQLRVGQYGKLFKIYKFRTMKQDAEKETGPVWAAQNDNRITPIGNFLRKTHIDELPQLFNILSGEMSLIGPRPERPKFVSEFKQSLRDYEGRLAVKPGLTGLAQVWHHYDETIEDVKKKLKFDLLYIKKMCFWADIRILLRTVRVVFTGEGAR